jgi:hypothetical protein
MQMSQTQRDLSQMPQRERNFKLLAEPSDLAALTVLGPRAWALTALKMPTSSAQAARQ